MNENMLEIWMWMCGVHRKDCPFMNRVKQEDERRETDRWSNEQVNMLGAMAIGLVL